jgi:ABC-type amino acid transport system permease subunit
LPFVGIEFEPFSAGIATFAIHYGAYMSEAVRGAVLSIDRAQWESGFALKLSRYQVARLVIIPQALRIVIPILATELIGMFKSSSLVALVSIPDLTFVGRVEALRTFQTVLVYSLVAGMYFAVAFPASILARRLERAVALA